MCSASPSPWHSLFFSMIGAMLCVMCIADERYFGMQLIFISTALMFMYYTWVIIQNMGKSRRKSSPLWTMASTGSDKKFRGMIHGIFLFILPANCEFLRLQLAVGFVFDGG